MKISRGYKYTSQQRKADNDLNAAKRIANNESVSHWFLGAIYPKDKQAVRHLSEVMDTYIKQRQQGITCLLGSRIGEVIKTKEKLDASLKGA